MSISPITLTDQIHLHNITSCISEIQDLTFEETYESFADDEEMRMTVYRTLMMLGIEAANITTCDITKTLDLTPLLSMKRADFINKLGKEYYSVFSFVNNDLPYFKMAIERYMDTLRQSVSHQPELESRAMA